MEASYESQIHVIVQAVLNRQGTKCKLWAAGVATEDAELVESEQVIILPVWRERQRERERDRQRERGVVLSHQDTMRESCFSTGGIYRGNRMSPNFLQRLKSGHECIQ